MNLRSFAPLPSLLDSERARELYLHDLDIVHRRIDRLFIGLLLIEWIAGILAAVVIAPRAWNGTFSGLHLHVYAAIYLGGAIVAFPILLANIRPGNIYNRHAIAIAQALYSSLLIHLTGGRIETHFHIFVSLAFLAMYRDQKVLVTASAIVAIDHILRGAFWPQSVYGTAAPDYWRWMEHVGWVAFEDIVLFIAIRQSLREMQVIANREAALESAIQRSEAGDQAKSAFLAQMSHEIRTPMTAILGYADMMAMESNLSVLTREPVHAIRRNGQHLLAILDDILDLSKMESGKLRVLRGPTDVAQLLADVQRLLNPRAAQRGITLALQGAEQLPPWLIMDEVRLRQIVLNLVSNAIKFTAQGGVIIQPLFDQTATGAVLSIHVIDTGIGLSEAQQVRLFKPFSQADDQHHRQYGGTGLGLAISQRLAQLMSGTLAVHSTLGSGSTFTVTLPTEIVETPPPTQSLPELPTTVPVISNQRRRILVVDDAPDNRRLLKRLLLHANFDVEAAEDGKIGCEAAFAAHEEGDPFDIILMDMLMPVMDGLEATRKLRAANYAGRIYALTANVSISDEARCREAGCDGYFTKPFDCERLLADLQKLFIRPRTPSAANPEHAATPDEVNRR